MSTEGFGSGVSTALVGAVELHEHEVPDLEPAVAVGIRRARRSARNVRAVVVENLAARTARSGFAHLPEVVGAAARLVADAHDTVRGQADLLVPDVERLLIRVVHGHHQALRIDSQPILAGDEVPGEANRVTLEVVAEAEVAQHLEERVVARGVADVLEVVVLAARPQRCELVARLYGRLSLPRNTS